MPRIACTFVTPSTARLLVCVALAALATACLPDPLSDAEITGRMTCGANGARRALDVGNADMLAMAEGDKFAFIEQDTYSMSAWLQARTLPEPKKTAPFLFSVASQTLTAGTAETMIGMGLSGPSDKMGFVRPTCAVSRTRKTVAVKEEHLGGGVVEWSQPVQAGVWYHVRCWFDPGKKRLYLSVDGQAPVDGPMVMTGLGPGAKVAGAALLLGAIPVLQDASSLFDGLLDEVHLAKGFDPAAATTVPARAADGEVGTVALYHMDGDSGSTLADSSPEPTIAVQTTYVAPATQGKEGEFKKVGLAFAFADEACRGFSFVEAACASADRRPPWCPAP